MSIAAPAGPSPCDPALTETLRTAILGIVGDRGWIEQEHDLEPYLVEERGRFRGRCLGVARPATTGEVAAIVRICAEAGVPIVPQGGNTGLVGGSVPMGGIVLSTSRLNRVRTIDTVNRTITVEAGVILSQVQAAADASDALFPLSLGAEESCHIGGNLATNAGGTAVLRYGNARELVLGLEVVLADGRIWDGLTTLRKNNTGYDLKYLFLGSEGTLGIITAAVLRLFPKPHVEETALVALSGPQAALHFFLYLSSIAGDTLTAFELMPRISLDLCLRHVSRIVDPFSTPSPFYVLASLTSSRPGDPLRRMLEDALSTLMHRGIIHDAVIAMTQGQADALWRLRESIPEAQKREGGSIKNDISVPISKIPTFIERATAACEVAMPGVRIVAFGHIGDGNIHFNLTQPAGMAREAFLAAWNSLERIVSDTAHDLGGSFSAEHGIGRLKRNALLRYKSRVELDLMRAIKQTLDPNNIMNPGVILESL